MADVIKIPYGFVMALSLNEWALICACVDNCIDFFNEIEKRGLPPDFDVEALRKLMLEISNPKSINAQTETIQ